MTASVPALEVVYLVIAVVVLLRSQVTLDSTTQNVLVVGSATAASKNESRFARWRPRRESTTFGVEPIAILHVLARQVFYQYTGHVEPLRQ
jgi:hypothetical protein